MDGCFLTIGESLTNKNIMKSFLLFLLTVFVAGTQCAGQNKTLDSLRSRLSHASNDTSRVRLMDDISDIFRDINPDTGIAYGKRALVMAEKANWKKGIAASHNCIGFNYLFLGDSINALQYCKKALNLYEQLGNTSGIAWSLSNIGSVYLFLLSDNQRALGYLERSLKLFQELNEKRGIELSFDHLAIAYETIGDYTRSLSDFQQAERINEEIGDTLGIAGEAINMGILYKTLAEYPKAIEYGKKAQILFATLGNKQGIASSITILGDIYLLTGKYDSALQYYRNSIEISKQIDHKLSVAQDIASMGKAYTGLAKYAEAMTAYQQAFTLFKALGYKTGMADALSSMANIYWNSPDTFMEKLGYRGNARYAIAATTAREAVRLSKEIGDLDVQRPALKELSAIYEKQKDYFNAYETYKQYVIVNDSIYNDEKQKQITHKEFEYEYSKKEELLKAEQDKKNALAAVEINKQKIIRNYTIAGVAVIALFSFFMIVAYNKRKKAKFERQVSEVEMQAMRLQMNPHFIFNCMHSINKYVMDNEKQLASEFLIRFSKLMRLILENSREKLIPISSDLLTLELYMQLEALRFKHKFDYSISVDPAIDTEKTLIPPMLLQPFVENSIVHGIQNRAGGLIKINISKEGGMIRCTVEDNGIGRKQAAHFKSTTETKKQSLGVKITQERLQIISQLKKVKTAIFMEDLKGTDNSNNGLRVELLLPLETEF
jgi:tetratricopeptide (TPR) repeat protein